MSAPDPEDLTALLFAALGYLTSTAGLARGWRATEVPDLDDQDFSEDRALSHHHNDELAELMRREHSIRKATSTAINVNARSVTSLTILSDLMLVLMVLGVVGAAVCAIASMWIATPIVAGVVPTAWIASTRLSTAAKKRQGMVDDLQKQRRENDRETIEVDRAKLELAVDRREHQLHEIEVAKDNLEHELRRANIRKYELEQELKRITAHVEPRGEAISGREAPSRAGEPANSTEVGAAETAD